MERPRNCFDKYDQELYGEIYRKQVESLRSPSDENANCKAFETKLIEEITDAYSKATMIDNTIIIIIF